MHPSPKIWHNSKHSMQGDLSSLTSCPSFGTSKHYAMSTGNIVPPVTSHVTRSLHKFHLELHIPTSYVWLETFSPVALKPERTRFYDGLKERARGHPGGNLQCRFQNRGDLRFGKLEGRLNPPELPTSTELPSTLVELTLINSPL